MIPASSRRFVMVEGLFKTLSHPFPMNGDRLICYATHHSLFFPLPSSSLSLLLSNLFSAPLPFILGLGALGGILSSRLHYITATTSEYEYQATYSKFVVRCQISHE